jgi:arrestin (S-antigen)-like protein
MKTFDVELEKQHYYPGERARGTVNLTLDSDTEIRSIKFLVLGTERVWTTVGYNRVEESYRFFSEDLYNFLKAQVKRLPSKKEKYGFSKGTWTIPFEFVLPENSLESYKGKHA